MTGLGMKRTRVEGAEDTSGGNGVVGVVGAMEVRGENGTGGVDERRKRWLLGVHEIWDPLGGIFGTRSGTIGRHDGWVGMEDDGQRTMDDTSSSTIQL